MIHTKSKQNLELASKKL